MGIRSNVILILGLLLALTCHAPTIIIRGPLNSGPPTGGAGGGGACNTTRDTSSGADNSGVTNQDYKWQSADFTAGATTTICKVDLVMEKDGTPPSATMTVAIYSATGTPGNPNAQIGTASDSINVNTLSDTPATVTFVNLSASITSGTRYHVVLKVTANGTVGNVVIWRNWDPTDATHQTALSDNSGTNWDVLSDTWPKFTLYSSN